MAIAATLAYLEVQIEGPNGWASALPTWRTTNPAITWLLGGRPVTGYHVALNALLLLFFHWPVLFLRGQWSLVSEARVLSSYVILAVVWDFLWFVINPHFGMARYNSANVWWFQNWFLGLPVDYYVGITAAVALRAVPGVFRRESIGDGLWEGTLFAFSVLLLTAFFAVTYLNIFR